MGVKKIKIFLASSNELSDECKCGKTKGLR